MSTIYICPLSDVHYHAAAVGPTHVVSLLGEDPFPATPPGVEDDCHLRLRFHDIDAPLPGHQPPETHHMEEIIDFGTAWECSGSVIVHCFAGVSRSTAAALTLIALHNPGREAEAAKLLRERAPHAKPNRRMIALADRALALDGRLNRAVDAMGEPDWATMGMLVEMPAVF